MTTVPRHVDLQSLRIEALSDPSDLANFSSGEYDVDRNIKRCCEWHDRYQKRTYCARIEGDPLTLGFYSIGVSATESKYVDRDVVGIREIFGPVAFIYLHYIAVRSEYQNNGIDTILLLHALEQAAETIIKVGNYGVALNALTDRAAGLYERYGFRAFDEKMQHPFMVLPARSVLELFELVD